MSKVTVKSAGWIACLTLAIVALSAAASVEGRARFGPFATVSAVSESLVADVLIDAAAPDDAKEQVVAVLADVLDDTSQDGIADRVYRLQTLITPELPTGLHRNIRLQYTSGRLALYRTGTCSPSSLS